MWLLAPSFRMLRIHRRLALEAKEVRSSDVMLNLVEVEPSRSKEERLQQLTDLATAAGTPETGLRDALKAPSYAQIVRAAGDDSGLGGELAEVIWRSCSAIAHGDISGTLSVLEREIVATEGEVALARVTGDIKMIFHMAYCAVQVLKRGFSLYHQRATQP